MTHSNSHHMNSLLQALSAYTPQQKLFICAAAAELLRHIKTAPDAAALADFILNVKNEFSKISFSLSRSLLSKDYSRLVTDSGVPKEFAPDVLLAALMQFVDHDLTTAAESNLQSIIAAFATIMAEDLNAGVPPKPAARPTVAIFTERLIERVFKPAQMDVQVIADIPARFITYRGKLLTGDMGPALRGLMLALRDDSYAVILETGEFVVIQDDPEKECVEIFDSADAYKNIPSSLLLSTFVAAGALDKKLGAISGEKADALTSGLLGDLLTTWHNVVISAADMHSLEHVFDTAAEPDKLSVTGPTGATLRVPVPDTDMEIVFEAAVDSHGPYSVSRLVQSAQKGGEEIVLMRRETPRLYSLRGIYLFPLVDCFISLTVID